MYLCAGLLHDHVGRLVLKELVGLEDLPGLRLVPRQHQGQLAQDADPGRGVRASVFKSFKKGNRNKRSLWNAFLLGSSDTN